MIAPPVPLHESERLCALDRYAILDTTPEAAFDELVQLASTVSGAPIALIGLIDSTRVWFKSRLGLARQETARTISLCAHAICDDGVFVVRDALADPRFADNPLVVDEPHIRFYAGAPLTTPDGHNLGTLCVIDREPRDLDRPQRTALAALARQVVVQLELRRQIMEKTIAERELRQSEARTRSIIENAIGALITIAEGGAIESVNPAAEQIFGYGAKELIGGRFRTLLGNFECAGALGRVVECEGTRKDGTTFTCELSLFEFYTTDDQRHFAAHMLDVSERHAVERMKKDFISTVSHELRTPLTSIRGSLGLLASGVMGELPSDAREMVTVAERNSVRLIALINDILDFDKLASGRMEMELRSTPLLRVLERSIESIAPTAAQDGVRIELRCADALVLGDEERLVQVTVNLLSNAVKYSSRGDTVTVVGSPAGDMLDVRVEDHGRGINADLQRKLFQRFQRADSSDARTKPGTGLGLAICKAIVEEHGGTIGVESREGEGSTFWFRVPVAAAHERELM
ncbi:MAG TPA: ATP-binding protein [Thermoanaerobaculia bacterium]|jgi:PAS domain S-box-containing protein